MILPDLLFLLSQVTTIRRMLPFEKPVQMGFWSQNQTTEYRAFARIRTRFSNKHPGFPVRIGTFRKRSGLVSCQGPGFRA